MTFRVFLTGSGIAEEARQFLKDSGCDYQTGEPQDTPADLIEKIGAYQPHALIVRQGKITAEVQAASSFLRVIAKHGVGTDKIDINAASAAKIPVFFTPNANFESVAEHTVAMILALSRSIPQESNRIRRGIFDKKGYGGIELRGKTLGLVGFGKIARQVVHLLTPFGMNLLVHHPSGRGTYPEHVTRVEQLDTLLKQSDIISLHCHYTPETAHMINRNSLAQMKPGALLVNTARGELVNESDLVEALKNGNLAGAALDVYENEPPDTGEALFQLENIILSTHVAGMSDKSFVNMGMQSAQHVLSVLQDGDIERGALKNPVVLD